MSILTDIIADKWQTIATQIEWRFELVHPYLVFLGLVALVGACEGNAWRQHQLYAGYYRLIFFAAIIMLLISMGLLTFWLITPQYITLTNLTLLCTAPVVLVGWGLAAGRPVIR